MARSLLDDDRYKLQFAGHETFPLRYGWLKKSYDQIVRVSTMQGGDTRSVFTDDAAIAYFGVGKNMVTSMRHWALSSGILEAQEADEGGRSSRIAPTGLGDLLLGPSGDPYLEHPASLWLVHWNLVATPERTTTWYWAFNDLHEPSFDRELLRQRLMRRCEDLKKRGRLARITEVTIRRDVECFIRTYASRPTVERGIQEDNLECPLTELSLIQPLGVGGAFQFRRGPKPTLPDEVFLFALIAFWMRLHEGRRSLSVEAITHEPGSPGRAFLLDEDSVADRLARLSELTGGDVRWDESTGLRQVYARDPSAVDAPALLRSLYGLALPAARAA